MPQLEHIEAIEAIEKRLWSAADNLRANSNYASNEYFLSFRPPHILVDQFESFAKDTASSRQDTASPSPESHATRHLLTKIRDLFLPCLMNSEVVV